MAVESSCQALSAHDNTGLSSMQNLALADDVEASSEGPVRSLHTMFPEIEKDYHILKVIGSGTFSSVFKAIDLKHHELDNSAWDTQPAKRYFTRLASSSPKMVAIKQVYAFASVKRIFAEIDFLLTIRHTQCKQLLAIITSLRYQDQVLIVLPYVQHADFRDFFLNYPLQDIAAYMRDLLLACESLNRIGVIHRDIKPGNFCWNPHTRQGVLVDFGLAQWEDDLDYSQRTCHCMQDDIDTKFYNLENLAWIKHTQMSSVGWGYFSNDRRHPKKAGRGGTRGFRAPEVLFRCSTQTTGLDIWSAGVILLCFLTQRLPFFVSESDDEALLELTNIFGIEEMTICAARHMCIYDCNLPNITRTRYSWHHLVKSLTVGQMRLGSYPVCTIEDVKICDAAFDFLDRTLDLDPFTRYTAGELLEHPFLNITDTL